MTDWETMYRGLSHAAWGYLFIHIDFNINGVSILPRFVGYLLLLSAIGKLSGERRDLALLRPLCILLVAWTGAHWLLSWVGVDLGGLSLPLGMVITAAGLYFHFQFLTDLAALAEAYQPEGGDLDQRLLRRRTVYIVMLTAADVLVGLPAGWFEDQRKFVVAVMMVVLTIVALFIMGGMFELRRCFQNAETEQTDI